MVPLFRDWPASALQKLCKVIGYKRFQKGDVIMVEGEIKPRWLATDDAQVSQATNHSFLWSCGHMPFLKLPP